MKIKNIAARSAIAALVVIGCTVGLSTPASATPISTIFSLCMYDYTQSANAASKAGHREAGNAIQLTGYALCYYKLSQLSGVSLSQQITYLQQYNKYLGQAQQAIAFAGLTEYQKFLKKGLAGLSL